MSKRVYMDFASTTYVSAEVLEVMLPFMTTEFGNASSIHCHGRNAEAAIAKARMQIANAIGASPNEIYFTSGATEANNWILSGMVRGSSSKRIIISSVEHPSILNACKELAKEGYTFEQVEVDKDGVIQVSDLINKLSKPCALVSIITANNEVGTIQFLNTIANLCNERGVPFHTDATQAIGSVLLDVKKMNISALTLNSHKLYGPKGVGALYIKNGLNVNRMMAGGAQERGRRAGTENVPGVVGFGQAVEITMRDSNINNTRIKTLRDYFIQQVQEKIQQAHLNGHKAQRLPNNVNFSFAGTEGEAVVMALDLEGVCASTGSACSSGSLQSSHVLQAMGLAPNLVNSSVRFTLGRSTTKDDIDFAVEKLVKVTKRLRSISAVKV